MKTRLGVAIAVAVAVGAFAAPASADTVANFTLDGVTFSDGGTATGTFTLDLDTSTLSNVNITTSEDGPPLPGSLGDTYTSGTFSNSPAASFDFNDDYLGPFGGDELIINLSSTLTDSDLASPGMFPIASGSETAYFFLCGEDEVCASRSITGGALDAVPSATPLPATLPLFAGGLGFVGYLTGRKKRKAGQALTAA
jgi:hypothetical protein